MTDPGARAIPVVLDVDTGVDDACALLLAALHPDLDLRAVTCVDGNAPLDDVVRNTLQVLDVAGASGVPVARGADRPLLATHARGDVHGADGMGDLGWPAPAARAVSRAAVELLRDLLLDAAGRHEPVTVVALAPMTNLALLLRTHPEVAAGIHRLVFMGGSAGSGNVTPAAEFNVWHDPEAAAIVLAACRDLGIAATMYGLDVFYAPVVTGAETELLCQAPGRSVPRLAGELIRFRAARVGQERATIGDAGAVCAVLDPAGLTVAPRSVRVELSRGGDRGRTLVGAGGSPSSSPVDVAIAVDARRYARLWLDTVGAG